MIVKHCPRAVGCLIGPCWLVLPRHGNSSHAFRFSAQHLGTDLAGRRCSSNGLRILLTRLSSPGLGGRSADFPSPAGASSSSTSPSLVSSWPSGACAAPCVHSAEPASSTVSRAIYASMNFQPDSMHPRASPQVNGAPSSPSGGRVAGLEDAPAHIEDRRLAPFRARATAGMPAHSCRRCAHPNGSPRGE
jgi:hypothetical protein